MTNLEIQFNLNIIKKVKSFHFQADHVGSVLFILFALYEERFNLLDEFDDFNKQKRAIILYKELERRGLITSTEGETLFKLTKAGVDLVEEIKVEHKVQAVDIAVKGVELEPSKESVESWIDAWLDIFPRGVKTNGRLLRSDKPSCLRKMGLFIKEHDYPVEVIMEATRNYIKYKESQGYAYTRCAVYFIYRMEGSSKADRISDLASWCEQLVHDREEGTDTKENNIEIMA